MPTPTYLSDEEIQLILTARQNNDIESCLKPVLRWIHHRVKVMVRNFQVRDDIEGECLLFFVSKVFPKIQIRALPPTSRYISWRINMYIRHQCNRYKSKVIDVERYENDHQPVGEFDTTVESTSELTKGGPTFTKVIRMLMEGKRQFEIARELGISRQRVWQLKQKMKRRWRRSE